MLGVLWTVLIGLVVGAVAKMLMPERDPGGIWITIARGIVGLGRISGWYEEGQSAGFIMSVIGAMLLLGIYHLIKRSTA